MKYKWLILLLFYCENSFSQLQLIHTKSGIWGFKQYHDNIIKATFSPQKYTTTENISDAVIAKPAKKVSIPISVQNDTIYIGINKKVKLLEFIQKDEYKSFRFILAKGEKFFGGGERALPLNRRGYRFNLYNNPWYAYETGADNLNYSVPFFTSSKGYGLFFDNPSKGYADIGKTSDNIFETGFASGELNVYIIFGNDYREILSSYHKLTGTQPLPPRWALGNFMSRFGYSSQAQVEEIADKMRKENIPFDAVIFDLFWFGDSIKGTMGNLDWINKNKWPGPKKMISNFKKQNIHTILITEPYVVKSSLHYKNSLEYHAVDSTGNPFVLKDFYFGEAGLIDIFRKDAQQWFWQKHNDQIKNGVAAWWGDLGEPERHPSGLYHNLKDYGYKRLFKADEVHNIYGHTWTKLLYKQYEKEYPDKRLFSLNRSGFAGSQRYGIFPWSGDVNRSWGGLNAQLPVMLGMSMSGVPYIHADAGGFAGGEGDNELYVRWLQFAAFTPILRPHGTALYDIDKNAFSFPSEPALIEQPYRDIVKSAIKLRYSLLPYNYTLAYRQATKGEPLVAPLYYYYPKDTIALNVPDEFMWGENILVSPVLEKGVKERKIYLPKGEWYKLGSNLSNIKTRMYEGSIIEDVNLSAIPVFVKAGSFIPMCTNTSGNTTADFKTDSLTIHYYYDKKPSQYILFDDDGITNKSIDNKKFTLLTIKAAPSGKKLIITFASNGGKFNTMPQKRNIILMIHGKDITGKNVYINNKKTNINFISPDSVPYVSFDFSKKPVIVEIK